MALRERSEAAGAHRAGRAALRETVMSGDERFARRNVQRRRFEVLGNSRSDSRERAERAARAVWLAARALRGVLSSSTRRVYCPTSPWTALRSQSPDVRRTELRGRPARSREEVDPVCAIVATCSVSREAQREGRVATRSVVAGLLACRGRRRFAAEPRRLRRLTRASRADTATRRRWWRRRASTGSAGDDERTAAMTSAKRAVANKLAVGILALLC
jgi:hypothetical protein